ncbi:MAG: NAD+ synthase [Planctomycetota bacterium]
MKIAIAQMNSCVGDILGNEEKVLQMTTKAKSQNVDLIVFPELCITGYPPKDLLEYRQFTEANLAAVHRIAQKNPDLGIILGHVDFNPHLPGKRSYNCASFLFQGKIQYTQVKTLLPTYDVFDEDRYFQPAEIHQILEFRGERLGIFICEDIWDEYNGIYRESPANKILSLSPTILLNLSASPFYSGKLEIRHDLVKRLAKRAHCPFVYVNAVGANDAIIFDGNSFVVNAEGEMCETLDAFKEALTVVDTCALKPVPFLSMKPLEALYQALVLGIREYASKCHFQSVVIGMSGGIDSALVAVLAVDALGPKNVLGVSMPSAFSSEGSVSDVALIVKNLGIRWETLPIHPLFEQFKQSLHPLFRELPFNVAEENLQARIRGTLLMALSNKFGYLVLSTGNKSEMAVGYCTLYGDMCGGLAVISDLPKTTVYELSHYLNREKERIPQNIIQKPPSAELRPNQKDTDSLPEYEILDQILESYIERMKSEDEIVEEGFDRALVRKILKMVDQNEYKRFQSPPGLKVTSKAFGIGRRIPLAKQNRWFH